MRPFGVLYFSVYLLNSLHVIFYQNYASFSSAKNNQSKQGNQRLR